MPLGSCERQLPTETFNANSRPSAGITTQAKSRWERPVPRQSRRSAGLHTRSRHLQTGPSKTCDTDPNEDPVERQLANGSNSWYRPQPSFSVARAVIVTEAPFSQSRVSAVFVACRRHARHGENAG